MTGTPTSIGEASSEAASGPTPARVGMILGFTYGIVGLASTATAVVVPTIREQFDLSLATGAWIITAFVIGLAASAPIYGRIADLVGPRTPITVGLGVMAVGAVLSAVAPTPTLLIVARGIVGAGAGSVPVLGPVIIAGRLDEPDRPGALTRMAGLAALAASGLLLGALIADVSSWRVVLAIPALATLFLGPVRQLSFDGDRGLSGLDIPGAIGVSAIAVGLNLVLQIGANPTVGVIGITLSLTGVFLSIAGPRRGLTPFIPRAVLRRSATWRIAVAAATIPACFFSLLIAVPAIFTEEFGATRIEIGLWVLPAAIVGVAMVPVAVELRKHLTAKYIAGYGLVVAAAGLLIASVFASEPIALLVSFVFVAIAFSVGQAALLGLLTTATPEDERGAGLAIFMVVFFLGGGIGGTLLTVVEAASSLPVAVGVLAALPAAAAISTLTLQEDPRRISAEKS